MPTADNINNASAMTGGALYVAPKGTTVPTDATTALANAYKALGYTAKDGFKMKIDRETVSWDTWESDDTVEIDTKHTVTTTVTPMETFAEDVAKLMFGSSNVVVASGAVTKITVDGDSLDECVLVVEMRLRNGKKCRVVLPRWKITSQGELTFNRQDPITSELQGKGLPDSSGGKAYIHFGTLAS